ncbi:hypothetical protein SMJ63A_110084 [Stenotrophomonas geniculata]
MKTLPFSLAGCGASSRRLGLNLMAGSQRI